MSIILKYKFHFIKIYTYTFFFLILLFCNYGCVAPGSSTVKVIKPKKHIFSYDPRWHKRAKRVRYVRMIQ